MQTIFYLYTAVGVLLIVISLPMMARRVPPNRWYGLRVSKTLKPGNEPIWYEANAYSSKLTAVAGAFTVLAAGVFYTLPGMNENIYAIACVSVLVVSVFASLIASLVYLSKL